MNDRLDLPAEAQRLRGEIAFHNAEIRRHRKQRAEAVDALTRVLAHLGIKVVPQHSKGAVHGERASQSR